MASFRWSPPHPFPTHSLPDLDGVQRALTMSWSEGPALFFIGHRDCATSRLTLPFVDRLYHRKPQGASVIAVLQDDPAAARALMTDLGLTMPVVLEADPYPLSSELELRAAPTLLLVGEDGLIARAGEGFLRTDLEAFSAALGIAEPLFSPDDTAPPRRPG
jgi:AhpC/TSA family